MSKPLCTLFDKEEVFAQGFDLGKQGDEQNTAAHGNTFQKQHFYRQQPSGEIHVCNQQVEHNDVHEINTEADAGEVGDGSAELTEAVGFAAEQFKQEAGTKRPPVRDMLNGIYEDVGKRVKVIFPKCMRHFGKKA